MQLDGRNTSIVGDPAQVADPLRSRVDKADIDGFNPDPLSVFAFARVSIEGERLLVASGSGQARPHSRAYPGLCAPGSIDVAGHMGEFTRSNKSVKPGF
jgi:hypothetical protein